MEHTTFYSNSLYAPPLAKVPVCTRRLQAIKAEEAKAERRRKAAEREKELASITQSLLQLCKAQQADLDELTRIAKGMQSLIEEDDAGAVPGVAE